MCIKGLVKKTANVNVMHGVDNFTIPVECSMILVRNSGPVKSPQLSRFLVCTNWSIRFNAHTTKAENSCNHGGISERNTHF